MSSRTVVSASSAMQRRRRRRRRRSPARRCSRRSRRRSAARSPPPGRRAGRSRRPGTSRCVAEDPRSRRRGRRGASWRLRASGWSRGQREVHGVVEQVHALDPVARAADRLARPSKVERDVELAAAQRGDAPSSGSAALERQLDRRGGARGSAAIASGTSVAPAARERRPGAGARRAGRRSPRARPRRRPAGRGSRRRARPARGPRRSGARRARCAPRASCRPRARARRSAARPRTACRRARRRRRRTSPRAATSRRTRMRWTSSISRAYQQSHRNVICAYLTVLAILNGLMRPPPLKRRRSPPSPPPSRIIRPLPRTTATRCGASPRSTRPAPSPATSLVAEVDGDRPRRATRSTTARDRRPVRPHRRPRDAARDARRDRLRRSAPAALRGRRAAAVARARPRAREARSLTQRPAPATPASPGPRGGCRSALLPSSTSSGAPTYLAIRVMVEDVPPLLGAGARFAIAGVADARVSLAARAARVRVARAQLRRRAVVGPAAAGRRQRPRDRGRAGRARPGSPRC